jgi:molecular chaperone DnaJ
MGSAGNANYSQGGFSDIFQDFFGDFMSSGGGRSSSTQQQGSDLRYNLQISLEDAFVGRQHTIKFSAKVGCDTCGSSGSADKSAPITCPYCNGTGRVRIQQGFFAVERTCASCGGEGKIIKNPCKSCNGQGRVNKERSVVVTIPAGIEDGSKIRLAGQGEVGVRGAPAGDLYVFVSVKAHPFFSREGNNLHCKIPVSITQAALGESIEVPTIEGSRAKLTIPAGAQNGDKLKLKAKGMSIVRSSNRGDMYVHTSVETPVNLNKRQKELLEEFASISQSNSNPQSESFFKKVKDFWGELKE